MSPCIHGSAHDCRFCQEHLGREKKLAREAFNAGFSKANSGASEEERREAFYRWWNDSKAAKRWKELKK